MRYLGKPFADNYSNRIHQGVFTKIEPLLNILVEIYDTGGAEKFRSIPSSLIRGVHLCIVMYDITNLASFHRVQYWIDIVKSQNAQLNSGIVFAIVGNKNDLSIKREVNQVMGVELALRNNAKFKEISVKEINPQDSVVHEIVFHAILQYRSEFGLPENRKINSFEDARRDIPRLMEEEKKAVIVSIQDNQRKGILYYAKLVIKWVKNKLF